LVIVILVSSAILVQLMQDSCATSSNM